MKMATLFMVLLVGLIVDLVSAPATEPRSETSRIYNGGRFQSGMCRSPSPNSTVYWTLVDQDTTTTFSDSRTNAQYNAKIRLEIDEEGHWWSQLTISGVNSTLDGTTILCSTNSATMMKYHVIVVEADEVRVNDGRFESPLCVSPDLSLSPYFTHNDNLLTDGESSDYYHITRNNSLDGQHQAVLSFLLANSTPGFNNSEHIITCLFGTATVIARYRLLIGVHLAGGVNASTTPSTPKSSTISDGTTTTEAHKNDTEQRSSQNTGVIAAVIVVLVVLISVILSGLIVLCIALHKCKRRDSVRLGPDDQQQPPPVASQQPVVPAPSNEQSTGNTTTPVICLPRRTAQRCERRSDVSRVNETNGSTKRTIDLDVVDIKTRCTSMRSCFVHGEDESDEIPPAMKKGSQEMTEHCEEHSMAVPSLDGNKNAYDLRKYSLTHVALPGRCLPYLQCAEQSDEETHDPETNQTTTEHAQ